LGFCRFGMEHVAFKSGDFDTKFVEKYFSPDKLDIQWEEEELVLLAGLAVDILEKNKSSLKHANSSQVSGSKTNWKNRLI